MTKEPHAALLLVVVVARPHIELDAEALTPVRQRFPKTKIWARAYDRQQLMRLMTDSEIGTVREVFESSVRMAMDGLKALGTSKESVAQVVQEFRRRDKTRLRAQFETGDMHAGQQHSFGADDSDDFLLDQA